MAPMDIVAVCDSDKGRAEAAGAATGASKVLTSLDDLLQTGGVDAAMVVVGPSAAPRIVPRLLAAGLDVFVEKPPALTVGEATAMRDAAQAAGRQLAVGFMKRFATGYRMASELVAQPDFGKVALINARLSTGVWTPSWSPQLDAFSFVLDHSVHVLDLLAFYGGPVKTLTALPVARGEGRMGFSCLLQFASGAAGVLEISNMESRGVPNERLQIVGDRGHSVTIENVSSVTYSRDARPMEAGRPFDTGAERLVWAPNMTNISEENSSLVHMGYAGEMRHFAASLIGGTRISPDIGDGIAAISLAHAVLASNGHWLDPSSLPARAV